MPLVRKNSESDAGLARAGIVGHPDRGASDVWLYRDR